MHEIALYYPFIHVRDDAWLKAAALYWPRMARLAPAEYPRYDSEIARQLSGELDFFLNIKPRSYARPAAVEFLEFIRNNREALQSRYSVSQVPGSVNDEEPYPSFKELIARGRQPTPETRVPADTAPDPRAHHDHGNIGWIHTEKLTWDLREELIASGLGSGSGPDWVIVAPDIAMVYTAALAEQVAESNDLAVVTDVPRAYGTLNRWDVEQLASALLGDDPPDGPALEADEVGALYAAVAIRTVVPASLDDIPVDRIIRARRKLAPEFDAFRDHLALVTNRLAELGSIKDPSILQARLELMVGRDLRRPAQDLEDKLRLLGLEPAQAVLGLKSLELPVAAAAAAGAVGLPPGVGQAGMVAARLVSSGVQSRRQRQQMLRSSPAGYLLGLEKHLTPGGIIERLRRTMTRAGKATRPFPP